MRFIILSALFYLTLNDSEEYEDDYYGSEEDIFEQEPASHDMSTPSPPLFQGSGLNDINIENIPICWKDSDNEDCGQVFINVADLENREKIFLADIGYLYLDYATEENGIHSLVYSGEGDVTAYFTYSGSSVIGTINRQDGKIVKIMSLSDNKQAMSLIDVPHSSKTDDDEENEQEDELGDGTGTLKNPKDEELMNEGRNDQKSIAKITVTVYYNADAEKQMMSSTPRLFISDLIQKTNDGYRKSRVPVKLVLHAFEKISSDKLSGEAIGKECMETLAAEQENMESREWDIMKDNEKFDKCYKRMIAIFRKSKGKFNRNVSEQIKAVKMGANLAVLLVNEIPDWETFCGRASHLYDIARKKANLAVVSIAGACPFTFGHEIGHILGLKHQAVYGEERNKFFSYGHGHKIARREGNKEGTRTIMATSSNLYKKRLNVYSNPEEDTGDSDSADNARVLKETRFLAAYTDEEHRNDMKYQVTFQQNHCQASNQCIDIAQCRDKIIPKTFLHKMCGVGKVCCEKSPECVKQFPEIEYKQDGWFMFGNRQNNFTLGVGGIKSSGVYKTLVSARREGDEKQMWKWDGDYLVSKWNPEYVKDGSVTPYTVAKRKNSIYQKWRLSDGFLVNLGRCVETTVVGGTSIARKWFRVDVDKREKRKANSLPALTFNTYICEKDEVCTNIDHCYEAVSSATMTTKFCDMDKVCCKNKVCHEVKEFETLEKPLKGWFVIESELNQKYLTVKEGKASSGQQVVNSSPKTDKQGQLWMWKEGYLLSKLDRSLVLDGTFGKVSIKKKKHGNIYQKWRKSGGFLVNAGHCEVLDVANGKKDNDALVTIWSVHNNSHQKWSTKLV